MHLLRAITGAFIRREPWGTPAMLRQANRVFAFHLAMLIWVPVFAGLYYLLNAPICACIVLSGGALLLTSLTLLRFGSSPTTCGNLLTAAAVYVYAALAYYTGGVGAPVMVWYASIPVLAVLLSGMRFGIFWTLLSVLIIACFSLARELGFQCQNEVSPGGLRFLQFAGLVGLLLCVTILVCVLKQIESSAQQTLHEANCQLELQAATDGLTGIGNRRSFDATLDREWKRHERSRLPLSVILIDVDFFKQYNDVYGHLAGDDCLRAIAQAIHNTIRRPGDFVARYGGEEFGVVLPNTHERGAARIAEQVRLEVNALKIPHPASSVCPFVTISVGTTTAVPSHGESSFDFLHDADMALYRAKANGRDQIVCLEMSDSAIEPIAPVTPLSQTAI